MLPISYLFEGNLIDALNKMKEKYVTQSKQSRWSNPLQSKTADLKTNRASYLQGIEIERKNKPNKNLNLIEKFKQSADQNRNQYRNLVFQ